MRTVDLVAGKSVRSGIDANVLGPDIAGRLKKPIVQRGRLHLALPVRYGQHRVRAGERQKVQAAGDKVRKSDAVMLGDGGKPASQLVGVVLGAVIDCRSWLRQAAEPVSRQDVRGTELQLDNCFAGGAFATEQRRLVYRDAIDHRPRTGWRGGTVPRLHVDEGQRAHRRCLVSLIFLACRADDTWDGVKSRLPAHRIVRASRGRHDRTQQLDCGAVVHPAADQTRRQRNQRRMIAQPGNDAVDQRVPVAAIASAGTTIGVRLRLRRSRRLQSCQHDLELYLDVGVNLLDLT